MDFSEKEENKMKFGIELEVVYLSVSNAIDIFRGRLYRDMFNDWQIKEDGSLHPFGVELVSPVFEWQNRGQVFDIIDILKRNRARSNQSTGFHVHMSGNFPNKWEDMKPTIARWYERIKPGFRPAKQRRDDYCSEALGQRKYQIVAPIIRAPEDISSYCNGVWEKTIPHIEIRLFNAHLCKRWVWRCLKASKELGCLLENAKQGRNNLCKENLLI
jgi:hypothetical protein